MSLASLADDVLRDQKEQVYASIFGHLAPSPYRWYRIEFAYCKAAFNGAFILWYKTRLEPSPWLARGLLNYAQQVAETPGVVYKFDGCCRANIDSSRYVFKGETTKILCP